MRFRARCATCSIRRRDVSFTRAAPRRRRFAEPKRHGLRRSFPQLGGLPFSGCMMPLLEVKDLTKHFDVSGGWSSRLIAGRRILKAVDRISFAVPEGKVFGLVGRAAVANRPRPG